MRESIVSFELAKLAKKAGFSNNIKSIVIECGWVYYPDGELIPAYNASTLRGYILAPTLSLVQKWLRDNKGYYISMQYDRRGGTHPWQFTIHSKEDDNRIVAGGSSLDYESTLSAALEVALEMCDPEYNSSMS